jgi:hypothetical protein
MSFPAGQACALCTRSLRRAIQRQRYASFSTSSASPAPFSLISGKTSSPGAEGVRALRETLNEAAQAGAASGSVVHNIQGMLWLVLMRSLSRKLTLFAAKNQDRARQAAGEARQRRLPEGEVRLHYGSRHHQRFY